MRRFLGSMIIVLVSGVAGADGWRFVNGRFPKGKVSVFTLTAAQKDVVTLYRRCGRDNVKSPYSFRLSKAQSAALTKDAGLSPERFAIFESYRGDDGVDLSVNVIVRFSEDNCEVPHDLLTRDTVAKRVGNRDHLIGEAVDEEPTMRKGARARGADLWVLANQINRANNRVVEFTTQPGALAFVPPHGLGEFP